MSRGKTGKTTLQVDRQIGSLVRRLAGYEGRNLSEMLQRMLEVYITEVWPDLELVYEEDDSASPDERRSGERRGAGYKGTGKPIPGADKPGINRRKGGQRRKKSTAKKKR